MVLKQNWLQPSCCLSAKSKGPACIGCKNTFVEMAVSNDVVIGVTCQKTWLRSAALFGFVICPTLERLPDQHGISTGRAQSAQGGRWDDTSFCDEARDLTKSQSITNASISELIVKAHEVHAELHRNAKEAHVLRSEMIHLLHVLKLNCQKLAATQDNIRERHARA
jgi:hypothetical protein